jgi:hypothetical protein
LAAVTGLGVAPASAQVLSEEERAVAAEAAYDRGTRAFRAEEWSEAARWYERADELMPADAALGQAIRSYRRAGDEARAAGLAALLISRDAGHAADHGGLVREVAARSVRLEVRCAGECELTIDGQEERLRVLFVSPDEPHFLRARFAEGERDTTVSGAAGETVQVELAPPGEEVRPPVTTRPAGAAPRDEPGGGLPVAVLLAAAGVTAVVGGVTAWSALDTSAAKSEYDADPTLERLEDGQARETRTNVLLAVTGGLAATTLVIAVLTDFSGEVPPEAEAVAVAPMRAGAVVVMRGAW